MTGLKNCIRVVGLVGRFSVGVVFILFFGRQLILAQQAQTPVAVVSMPDERADDSYRIYSLLMPGREFTGVEGMKQWLIERTTVDVRKMVQSPREAIDHGAVIPEDRRQELNEVLDDFDQHSNERVQLTEGKWSLPVPHRLLTEQETKLFNSGSCSLFTLQNGPPEDCGKFAGAPGLNSFSEVYFSGHHSIAMVYTQQTCGGNCGTGYWVVLELRDGQWKQLPWTGPGWEA